MDTPLSELQKAHQELMSRYVAVLEEVRRARWFMPRNQAPPEDVTWLKKLPNWLARPLGWIVKPHSQSAQGKSFAVRSLVHLFVEGHIRRKLKELSEGYLALRAQAPADAKDLRDWAKDCSDVCDKMAGTLATWASIEGAFRALWPFAFGGLAAWLGAKDIWEIFQKLDTEAYVLAFLLLFFPAIYLFIFMSASFGYRREMFIPGFDANERPFDSKTAAPDYNIYLLEDRLFDLINRTKSREKPWDLYLAALGMLVFGSLPLIMMLDGDKPPFFLWVCSAVFWIFGIVALAKSRKRIWR